MLGILRQKVGAGSSSAMTLGQRIRPATSAMRGFASSAKEVLLGDVGAGKSSLVLRFVKEQFVEFQVLWGEAHLKFIGRTREEADSNRMVKVKEKDAKSRASELLLRRKAIHTANKAAQRYERDTNYCFLHNCVSDIFAQCLKSDIEKFHHHKDHNHDHHDDYCLEITQTATSLPTIANHHMLLENIARKEVLSPLRKTMAPEGWEPANRWGYRVEYKREQLVVANEIDPGYAALLSHDILSYIKYPELEQEADVKWKKMVEVYSKQVKLKNWVAV
ncbi:hypothetical protein PS1_036518 [Malus domestica]